MTQGAWHGRGEVNFFLTKDHIWLSSPELTVTPNERLLNPGFGRGSRSMMSTCRNHISFTHLKSAYPYSAILTNKSNNSYDDAQLTAKIRYNIHQELRLHIAVQGMVVYCTPSSVHKPYDSQNILATKINRGLNIKCKDQAIARISLECVLAECRRAQHHRHRLVLS